MRKSHLITAGLLILFIVLIARLIWTASHTETGWTVLKRQWLDATVGEVVGDYSPISRREPADQADFWLKEAKLITSADPENTELAMGAALVLDFPAIGFLYRYPTVTRSFPSSNNWLQINMNEVNQAMDRFEDKCRAECLAMAARATELQPDDVRWWRLRALLQFRSLNGSSELEPRNPSWLEILEQCKIHDPDNAIYDYLAALHLWNASIEDEYAGGKTDIKMTDRHKYDKALQFFQKGQKKKNFLPNDYGSLAAISLLERSEVPCSDHADIAINRQIQNRIFFIPVYLLRNLSQQIELAELNRNPAAELNLLREQLHMLERFLQSNGMLMQLDLLYSATLNQLQTFAKDNPELVSAEEAAKIKIEYEKTSSDGKLFMEASKRMADRQNKPSFYVAAFLNSLLVHIALLTALPLLIIGMCVWAIVIFLGRKSEKPAAILGPFRHTIAWFGGYILTFLVLGMASGDVISLDMQKLVGACVLLIYGGLIVNLLFWKFIYRRKFPYVIRASIVMTSVLALLIGILELCNLALYDQSMFCTVMNIPPDPWYGINPAHFMDVIMSEMGLCFWVLWNWFAHAGPYLTIAISLALLVCWYHLRYARKTTAAERKWKSRWAGMFGSLGRSSITVGIIWLFIYLLFAPSLLQTYEDRYQSTMSFVRNPDKYNEMLEKTMAEVKEDWKWMNDPQIQNQEDSSD
jgi:hypothetical protein